MPAAGTSYRHPVERIPPTVPTPNTEPTVGYLRNGKEFGGPSRADSALLHQSITLEGFSLQSLIQPAQILQEKAQLSEEGPDLPTHAFSLRPRSPSLQQHQFIALQDLSTFRLTHSCPSHHARHVKPFDPPLLTKRERSLAVKRQAERASRRLARAAEQMRLRTNVKGFQRARVHQTRSRSIQVDFDVAGTVTDAPTWTGDRNDRGKWDEQGPKSLEAALAVPGMRLISHDGSENLLIRDSEGTPFALFSDTFLSSSELQATQSHFDQAPRKLGIGQKETFCHRRGDYITKSFGISFGGGQLKPCTLRHSKRSHKVWKEFSELSEIRRVSRRADYLFQCYFPRLHALYANILEDICESDHTLVPNWSGSCFAASSINLGNAVTVGHRDYLNLLFGQCAIFSTGTFDYTKGGHLILWDMGLIVEFPPGCIALIPSAMIRHSNTTIAQSEARHSMTFYSASGLFRWRHNGFMSDREFRLRADRAKVKAWEKHREDLWRVGLNLMRDS